MADSWHIAHLTDPHLTENQQTLYGGSIDPWGQLRQTFEALARGDAGLPDAVVISGDLCQRGHDAYAEVAGFLTEQRRRLGCPILVVPGNHDEPGAIDARFHDPDTSHTDPHDASNSIIAVPGLRLIGLNTHGYGHPHGWLETTSLDWLEHHIRQDGTEDIVLVLHHPPVPGMIAGLRHRGLLDSDSRRRLAEIMTGSRVCLILSGHYHLNQYGSFAGIPVSVAPGIAYSNDPLAPRETILARAVFGFVRVEREPPGPPDIVSSLLPCSEPSRVVFTLEASPSSP
ncbi:MULTISPECIES: metallophosphoesterase [Auritidibacter]|uniref:metallophosphoesterase n=1 Tax=Auritidibacter TaxID=1160973 RepID=UPI00141AB8C5|nr:MULTISPECIES: metallophosphoesterase [Auritidibacter]NIH71714.1 3',5'-cyclic AMP phosphodiesterase CpdA [Auritidibacter ignavus]WGH82635.1 metallophosphoesterase [Auritidibacter ignavus]